MKMHPKYQNGEMTEEQIFKKFLNTFEVGSNEVDGTVRIREFIVPLFRAFHVTCLQCSKLPYDSCM